MRILTEKLFLKPAFVIFLSSLLLACSSISNRSHDYGLTFQLRQNDSAPKSVVIMPFINETPEKGLEIIVRKSFYNNFSSKNYRDYELSGIDRGLEILRNGQSTPLNELEPSKIGKHFNADYIIYGKIKKFNKIFLGIYSQIVLKMKLEIADSRTGDVVWEKTISRRSHEGGLPFNPFGIIPAALRSGYHMKSDSAIELIDKVNRELAEQIPEPYAPSVIPYYLEIQVASFLENRHAENTLREFQEKGFNPRIETVNLVDRTWHRVILGPYYNLPEAEKIRDRITADPRFKPILIHRYPETTEEKQPSN